ncbi:MAG: hypothetical protein JJLCMIEE_02830 [Acidimicrobiales bacterium]|nr:hypothetical protein [Acidimicrobiales bacterium]
MADQEHVEDPEAVARPARAREVPLHTLLGLEFERPQKGARRAEVRMPVRPEAFGLTANLHGGAIATLVDLACALAAARSTDFDPLEQSLVTADMHIRYLGRARTGTVIARSEVVRIGSQLIVVECKVVDEEEHVIATADFSMMIVPLRRPLAPGMEPEPGAPEL